MRVVKIIIVLFFLCIETTLYAEDYPDWEGYPPMFSLVDVIEFKGLIYGVCECGMVCYNPGTEEWKLFYKNKGLEANNVLSIGSTSQEIFVGFEYDGLMRFDPETEQFDPVLFPEYVDKEDVLKTLAVNDIYALNDSILYIGHEKGVDRLNLYTEEIRTYSKLSPDIQEDTPVTEVKIFKGKLWACTSEGLAWADVDNPNLEFEENWESVKFHNGVSCIIHYVDEDEDIIFVGTESNGIFTLDIETKETESISEKIEVYSFSDSFGTCYAASNTGLFKKFLNKFYLFDNTFLSLKALSPELDNKMWVATSDDGLQCFTNSRYQEIPPIHGPRSSTFRKIDITEDNVVWAATSWRDDGGSVQRFHDDIWISYHEEDGLPSIENSVITNSIFVDTTGIIWGATWGRGVYVHDDNGTPGKEDDIITSVDSQANILLPYDDKRFVVCPDITGDASGNIWIAGWNKGVYVLEGKLPVRDYRYHHFSFDTSGTVHNVRRVFIDDEGWVWLGTWDTGVIGMFIGDDPYDTSDDDITFIYPSDGLLSNRIEAIHTDIEGFIWIGTDGGLNRITKLPNNELEIEDMNHLFGEETVEVNSIEVDRFNNKWLGTSKGLVKLNSDNQLQQIYTTENSGIFFKNNILSLKYDDNRDILWIGTDTGLNKFYALKKDSGDSGEMVYVYPNPFEIWGYNSRAVFTNLKPFKPVRIYNFNGELVNEIISDDSNESSTAVWNGNNFKGEFVGSGVYFFTGTDSNGHVFRKKMVVIRR